MSDPSQQTPSEEAATQSQARAAMEASLQLLWKGHTPADKGPKPTLTLDQIVTTAIEIADADGVEALSMRRLARELGVGAMSLYRYVPDKSVLLDLMLDRVSVPSATQQGVSGRSWREALEADAWEGRARYLKHPWLLQVNWSRPVLGPNSIAAIELVMSTAVDVPLTDREKVMVVSLLDAYVTGSVRQQVLYESAAEETGMSEEEFWQTQLPFLEAAMTSGRYPTMASLEEEAFDGGWKETFAMGLRYVIDGLVADLERRAASRRESRS